MSINEVTKTRGRASKRPNESELTQLYQKMTAKEIATHYGVATSTVKGWIYSYKKENEKTRQRA